ncbi:hypothetical protein ACFSTH_07140 [Paenibacillus yanchengensis]|uniref:Helix-turn-helix domain-containing protein n=1 Tax=Paenibacillus yanchengensis TaxID=2035833 RepID=A0ABW4YHX9_9BACL
MAETNPITTKRTFTHLTAFDRGKISALKKEGWTLQAITDEIGKER